MVRFYSVGDLRIRIGFHRVPLQGLLQGIYLEGGLNQVSRLIHLLSLHLLLFS